MKKSHEINELNDELYSSLNKLNDNVETISLQLSEYKKKIKKEMSKIVAEEKLQLLFKISEDYDIDINILKNKYLKSKELNILNKNNIKLNIDIEEELLDKIEYNNNIYYYENKEKGKVYDINNIEVGIFKNDKILFNELLVSTDLTI
jgi:hypothetical protein